MKWFPILALLTAFVPIVHAQEIARSAPLTKADWEARLGGIRTDSINSFFESVHALNTIIPHANPNGSASCNLGWRFWRGLDTTWSLSWEVGHPVRVMSLTDTDFAVPARHFETAQVLHRVPNLIFEFDPVHMIRAVNHFQALGEQRAQEELLAYATIFDDYRGDYHGWLEADSALWMIRFLWEPKDPTTPLRGPAVGSPTTELVGNSALRSTLPFALHGEIPFRVTRGYNLGGVPESVADYLEYCRSNGSFRSKPLHPTCDAFTAAEAVIAQCRIQVKGFARDDSNLIEDLRGQALSAMGTVLGRPQSDQVQPNNYGNLRCSDSNWERAILRARDLKPVWDAALADFVPSRPAAAELRDLEQNHPASPDSSAPNPAAP